MSRIGVSPAAFADSTVSSSHPHEYSGDVGSAASNPEEGALGAIALHVAMMRAYEAPEDLAFSKPAARSGPVSVNGSTTDVRRGSVAGVT
jgi:hypothetical protein